MEDADTVGLRLGVGAWTRWSASLPTTQGAATDAERDRTNDLGKSGLHRGPLVVSILLRMQQRPGGYND